MKYVSRLLFLLVALMAMTNCGQRNGTPITETDELVKQNSMYYWKTTFDIDSTDVAFLETHNSSGYLYHHRSIKSDEWKGR